MLNNTGLKNHYDSYKRYVTPLTEAGYIEYTLPDIPKSRKQKCIRTALGEQKISSIHI